MFMRNFQKARQYEGGTYVIILINFRAHLMLLKEKAIDAKNIANTLYSKQSFYAN